MGTIVPVVIIAEVVNNEKLNTAIKHSKVFLLWRKLLGNIVLNNYVNQW